MLESTQEKIVAVSSLFGLLIGVIFFSIRNEIGKSVYLMIVSLISIILTVYNIHCVVFGSCTAWSWILTLLVTGSAIMTVIMYGRLIALDAKGQLGMDESQPLQRRVVVLNAGTDY